MPSMSSPASPRVKITSRMAASSRARRRQLASAAGPRARTAPAHPSPVGLLGSGRAFAPGQPAGQTSLPPQEQQHGSGRGAWASNTGGRSMTGSSATTAFRSGVRVSTPQGAVRRSRTPPWTTTGSAGVSGAALWGSLRHCTRRSPGPLGSEPVALDGTAAPAPVSGRSSCLSVTWAAPPPRLSLTGARHPVQPPWPRTGRGDSEVARS